MGQHMARTAIKWLKPKHLVLVDHATEIMVGTEKTLLTDFASHRRVYYQSASAFAGTHHHASRHPALVGGPSRTTSCALSLPKV